MIWLIFIQLIEPSKLSELRNQENGNIPYANESTIPNQNIEPTNVNQNSITVIDSSNLSNGFHSSNIRNGDAFEAYETLGIGTDNFEGKREETETPFSIFVVFKHSNIFFI